MEKLIVSNEPISFLGGVDPETGIVIDPNHELKGQSIKDKVLFIPEERFNCRILCYISNEKIILPKAIICLNAEPIIATGPIMSDIPMVDSPEVTDKLKNGVLVEVDGDNGKIAIL